LKKNKHNAAVVQGIRAAIGTWGGEREEAADPRVNGALESAIAVAKRSNVPKEVWQRAIERERERDAGGLDTALWLGITQQSKSLLFALSSAGKAKFLPEVRQIVRAYNGAIVGEAGLRHLFTECGRVVVADRATPPTQGEQDAAEAGAEDSLPDDDVILTVIEALGDADVHDVAIREADAPVDAEAGEDGGAAVPRREVVVDCDRRSVSVVKSRLAEAGFRLLQVEPLVLTPQNPTPVPEKDEQELLQLPEKERIKEGPGGFQRMVGELSDHEGCLFLVHDALLPHDDEDGDDAT